MKYKIVPKFFFIVVALILGVTLFEQFDFEQMKFEKPALAVIYSIVFVICIGLMIKRTKNEKAE